MNTIQLMNEMNTRFGWSDYRIAEKMNVHRSTVSAWRRGISGMNEDQALKAAELLDLNPEQVFVWLRMEKSKSDQVKEVWERLAKMAGRAAAFGAGIIALNPVTEILNATQWLLC